MCGGDESTTDVVDDLSVYRGTGQGEQCVERG